MTTLYSRRGGPRNLETPLTLTPAGHEALIAADLAAELGRVRYERDLLLRQVLAVHAGLEDGTATTAWRTLLRTARWLAADDSLGEPA